jgi:N-acetylglucosaminyl-diphospho-decaprenol L-rhamnosyltransferase
MNVAIVIVNFRTAEYVERCLDSLSKEVLRHPTITTTVCDNFSEDGSVERLTRFIEMKSYNWATVMPLPRNGGFAFGNNSAIRDLLQANPPPDLIWLLNPDTSVREGAVTALAGLLADRPQIGVLGARLVDEQGVIVGSARRMIAPFTEFLGAARLALFERIFPDRSVSIEPRAYAHECDWVSGASMVVRREVFEEIGLMDEGYFLYFEEVDFCMRANERGWQTWFSPNMEVTHFEGASTGIAAPLKRRPAYWFESRRRFFSKHYGIKGVVIADIWWALGRLLRVVADFFRINSRRARNPNMFAYDLLWGDVRALIDGSIKNTARSESGAVRNG